MSAHTNTTKTSFILTVLIVSLLFTLTFTSLFTTALTIENKQAQEYVISKTDTSVTLQWSTDIPTTTDIYYGTTADSVTRGTSERKYNNTPTQLHTVTLTGLTPRTKYYFKLVAVGNKQIQHHPTQGTLPTFFTGGTAGPGEINILDTAVSASTSTQTTLAIKLDIPATLNVTYGTLDDTGVFTAVKTITSPEQETHTLTFSTTANMRYRAIPSVCTHGECDEKTSYDFLAGPLTDLPLELYTAAFVKTNTLDITGLTAPFIGVKLYINNDLARYTPAAFDGRFTFPTVQLPTSTTTIRALAEASNGVTNEKTATVTIDSTPPTINLTSMDAYTSANTLTLTGTTSEQVTLIIPNYVTNTTLPTGTFNVTITLNEGKNDLDMTFTDRAGNLFKYGHTITKDTTPPAWITPPNLNDFKPTFSRNIKISGQVSEKANILIYLNNGTPKLAQTSNDGKFSQTVQLEKTSQITTGNKDNNPNGLINSVSASYGMNSQGFKNSIRVDAVDFVGNKIKYGPEDVIYATCGFGSAYNVLPTEPSPGQLTPRLLIDGMQQIGLGLNITPRTPTTKIQSITVDKIQLGNTANKEYDNDRFIISTARFQKPSWGAGFINLQFNPWDPYPGNQSATTFQREENISQHRAGTGDCKFTEAGIGCFKAMLQVNIRYTDEQAITFTNPDIATTLDNSKITQHEQRVCMPIEIAIDRRINPDIIPSNFIKNSIKGLDRLIKNIDDTLKPVKNVAEWTLYACSTMRVWDIVLASKEVYSCKLSLNSIKDKLLDAFSGGKLGDAFTLAAQSGMCEEVFNKQSQNKERDACKSCEKTKRERTTFQNTLRTTCDRLEGPSAPTLQKYITDKQNTGVKPLTYELPPTTSSGSAATSSAVTRTVYVGSSCAFKEGQDYGGIYGAIIAGYTTGAAPYQSVTLANIASLRTASPAENRGIKEVYIDFLAHKNDKATTTTRYDSSKPICDGLHPADPRCCGFEYQQQWGSACGVPGLFDTFNEIKESACLAAQNAGPDKIQELERLPGTNCNVAFNKIAGICERDVGKPASTYLGPFRGPTGVLLAPDKFAPPESRALPEILVRVQPDITAATPQDKGHVQAYNIELGYARNSAAGLFSTTQVATGQPSSINIKTDFVPLGTLNQAYFGEPTTDAQKKQYITAIQQACTSILQNGQTPTTNYISQTPALPIQLPTNLLPGTACTEQQAENIYTQVRAHTGAVTSGYIVQPQSSTFRSMQCVDIPATYKYLHTWRNIFAGARNCLQTIDKTGDGSAGQCQAALSQNICDGLYDVLQCTTQFFSTSAGSRGGGIGNIIGAISKGGEESANDYRARYGDNSIYNVMFVDKKLLNSVCLFAFTGNWDIDPELLFEQGLKDVPIASYGLVYPAERRYITYDPTSSPTGLTTWNYRIGLSLYAGSDITFALKLTCSNDLSCSPEDGYVNGKCDCYGKEEKTLNVPLPKNQLASSDEYTDEISFNVNAGGTNSHVRYDTAELVWETTNPTGTKDKQLPPGSTSKKVGLKGGNPPGYCGYDLFAFAYRCQLNLGDYTSAKFVGDPTPKYAGNKDYFKLNEDLNFNADIIRKGPDTPGLQYNKDTKYLVYTLYNKYGRALITNDLTATSTETMTDPIPVNENGEVTVRAPQDTLQLNKEHFSVITTGTDIPMSASQDSFEQLFKTALATPQAFRGTIPAPGMIIVVHKNSTDKGTARIYLGTNTARLGDHYNYTTNASTLDYGYFTKNKYVGSGNIFRDTVGALAPFTINVSTTRYTISLDPSMFNNPNFAHAFEEVYLFPSQPTTTPANDPCTTKQKVDFTMAFELRDAQQDGGAWLQSKDVTIDTLTNKPQTKTIQFTAICSDTDITTPQQQLSTCPDDPTTQIRTACFCAQPQNANVVGAKYDCGQATGQGEYCHYQFDTQGSVTRACARTPQTTIPNTSITFEKLSVSNTPYPIINNDLFYGKPAMDNHIQVRNATALIIDYPTGKDPYQTAAPGGIWTSIADKQNEQNIRAGNARIIAKLNNATYASNNVHIFLLNQPFVELITSTGATIPLTLDTPTILPLLLKNTNATLRIIHADQVESLKTLAQNTALATIASSTISFTHGGMVRTAPIVLNESMTIIQFRDAPPGGAIPLSSSSPRHEFNYPVRFQ